MIIERWHIIVACIVFIVLWMSGKRLFGKSRAESAPKPSSLADEQVESWYSAAQERAAFADEPTRQHRAASWDGLAEAEQLSLSDDFIANTFGAETSRGYTKEEKLRIGRMSVMTGDQAIAP